MMRHVAKVLIFISIGLFSSTVLSADKVIECRFINDSLLADCPNATATNLVTMILNTDDFSKSSAKAEFSHGFCSENFEASSYRVPMTVTSTTLSFNDDGYSWNVDRKTLTAGWGTKRDATCEISDLDTSSNQIWKKVTKRVETFLACSTFPDCRYKPARGTRRANA